MGKYTSFSVTNGYGKTVLRTDDRQEAIAKAKETSMKSLATLLTYAKPSGRMYMTLEYRHGRRYMRTDFRTTPPKLTQY